MRLGEIAPPPVATLIGFALTADARHTNPMGTLHGGMAYAATLDVGETFTTLEARLVARATSTGMTFRGDEARGR